MIRTLIENTAKDGFIPLNSAFRKEIDQKMPNVKRIGSPVTQP
jgi:hypothetical protein